MLPCPIQRSLSQPTRLNPCQNVSGDVEKIIYDLCVLHVLYQMHRLINCVIIVHIRSHMGPARRTLLIMGGVDVPRAMASLISPDCCGPRRCRTIDTDRYRGVGRGTLGFGYWNFRRKSKEAVMNYQVEADDGLLFITYGIISVVVGKLVSLRST